MKPHLAMRKLWTELIKSSYQYYKNKNYSPTLEGSNYGVSAFTRLRIARRFYAHLEFAEMNYNDDCKQDGTILTDLTLGKINLTEMKAEIFCRKKKYAELKIKN